VRESDRGKELWHLQRRYCSRRGDPCEHLCESCERRGGAYIVDGNQPRLPACTEQWHGRGGCTAILDGWHAGRCDRDELLFVYRGRQFNFASRFEPGSEWQRVRSGKWERVVRFNTERGEWRQWRSRVDRSGSATLTKSKTEPSDSEGVLNYAAVAGVARRDGPESLAVGTGPTPTPSADTAATLFVPQGAETTATCSDGTEPSCK